MAADARAARLSNVFHAFLHGKRAVSGIRDAELFLEAAQTISSPSECLEFILSSPSGVFAVHRSVRASATLQFICNHALPFIGYLSQPEAKAICEGAFLRQILVAIVEPPTAWNILLEHYTNGGFADKDIEAFAWLCFEIVQHSGSELAAVTSEIESTLKIHPFNCQTNAKAREFGYQIQKVLQVKSSSSATATEDMDGPGGRHDNDFADFRRIAIFPTRDELSSTIPPFYRLAKEVANSNPAERTGTHLDNQFRLLREDMLAELREDIRVAMGKRKGRRRAQILSKLLPIGIDTGDAKRGRHCALLLSVGAGLEQLTTKKSDVRKTYLKDNKNIMRHQSFGALCLKGEVICFAFVVRDIDNLVKDPPIISLQFCSSDGMAVALSHFHAIHDLVFIIIDTPVFAYEPVLERLKEMMELPLEEHLLQMSGDAGGQDFAPADHLKAANQNIRQISSQGKQLRIGGKAFDLDEAQADALTSALERPLAIIQGPPGESTKYLGIIPYGPRHRYDSILSGDFEIIGTGKSFVGALAVKLLLQGSEASILVLSYTNHALDQFLEDLISMGIDAEKMTRLGFKSSAATAHLSFHLQSGQYETRRTKAQNALRYRLREELDLLRTYIESDFHKLAARTSLEDILDYLEFSDTDELQFWWAFQILDEADGFQMAGKNGQAMKRDYLLDLWLQGKEPKQLEKYISAGCRPIWNLEMKERLAKRDVWVAALRAENIEALQSHIKRFDSVQHQIDAMYNESRCAFIKTKGVIGCTTTAAAKYSSLIKAAGPAYILVEEAGEILEAHILSALSLSTRGLILIGDHKQLRPKCKNYALSVEKGSGYDLNRSLSRGSSCKDIPTPLSASNILIRAMTYPDLQDGEKTLERPRIRGLRDRVAFVNHSRPEGVVDEIGDRQDADQKTSKENKFEAGMVLKTVKYLGQQGYQTSNIVVLTPYLGQLRLLRDMMSKDDDPLLSDLDSHELIRAGLLTAAAAKVNGGQIRLSTIDNYQGEESDIVVVSLTRSNNRGDIGFMKSPERLNVLLSRARNGIILFGNMETFLASPQGKDCWIPFFDLMKEKKYLQDSLEVYCQQHPKRISKLSVPQDFDLRCPDGGCSQACGATLSCGLHTCQRRCHRVADHSNITCHQTLTKKCDKLHEYKVPCGDCNARCRICIQEEADIKRRTKRDFELEKDRLAKQSKYRQELQDIQDEIQHLKRQDRYQRETEDQTRALEQQRADLAALKKAKERQWPLKKMQQAAKAPTSKGESKSSEKAAGKDAVASAESGGARYEWECLKRDEFASNDVLDTLMGMIGLESVKMAFLGIKSTVDTAIRQGVPTENERFGCSPLGNPGTGK
ncbi:NFX1-type zinc finger-containing protein 1 [Beauveria bassiana]|nr:NFX1-type zinc finger-containing protein 1 [Beauveria bassiana]KAH8715290.1 NFX1-type zinc finger-containing protein 1 [Beauveria bassiana]